MAPGTVRPVPPDPHADYVVRQMRDAIIDTDLKLLQLLNQRLTLVKRLREYKASQGMPFVDPERERWMHSYLQGANRGPLSPGGLDRIYDEVLELTKRESGEDAGA